MTCDCETICRRFGFAGRRKEICQGTVLTPKQCEAYRKLWQDQERRPLVEQCVHRGEATGELRNCELCGSRGEKVPVYVCELHERCTLSRWTLRRSQERLCLRCQDLTLADGTKPLAVTVTGTVPRAVVPNIVVSDVVADRTPDAEAESEAKQQR